MRYLNLIQTGYCKFLLRCQQEKSLLLLIIYLQTKRKSRYLHGHRKTNQKHEETCDPDEDLLPVSDSEVMRPEIHHGRHETLHTHELSTGKH